MSTRLTTAYRTETSTAEVAHKGLVAVEAEARWDTLIPSKGAAIDGVAAKVGKAQFRDLKALEDSGMEDTGDLLLTSDHAIPEV